MSAKDDAVKTLSTILGGGHQAPAPAGLSTKTIGGVSVTVNAATAWNHSTTDQTDVPTIKTYLNALVEDYHKRGDVGRANALVRLGIQF